MANKQRGEVSFKAGDDNYTLRYSINALCVMEGEVGKGFAAIAGDLSNPDKISFTLARAVLWAGLKEHHSDITIEEAGELIPAAGGLTAIMFVISEALTHAFPDNEKKTNASRPQKEAGTGSLSYPPISKRALSQRRSGG